MSSTLFILTGASNMGIKEEYFFEGQHIDEAATHFALHDFGPIIAIDIAANLLAQETITIEQYDLLEAVLAVDGLSIRKAITFVETIRTTYNDTTFNCIGEHVRALLAPPVASAWFLKAFDALVEAISDIASGYFNYGQFKTDPYEWGSHNNVVDVLNHRMQWKIYAIKSTELTNVKVYPKGA